MKKCMRLCIVFGLLLIGSMQAAEDSDPKVDLLVFSYNRPLQLYAFLESVYENIVGLSTVSVVVRIGNDAFRQGYNIVKKTFPDVIFYEQGNKPRSDFKALTLRSVYNDPRGYIIFAVDDIVVQHPTDVYDMAYALEETEAYAFLLRIGKNITEAGWQGRKQAQPKGTYPIPGIFAWNCTEGGPSWRYPNTLDMGMYRKSDIKGVIERIKYNSPNTFEGMWAKYHPAQKKCLCYECSRMVNIPLNRIQEDGPNNHLNLISTAELLNIFIAGKKLDIVPVAQLENKAPHWSYVPTFVDRD